MTLTDEYFREKAKIVSTCKACGRCFRRCPVVCRTPLKGAKPNEVQQAIKDFLSGGSATPEVYHRAFSCMECFRCLDGDCPEGLNPMQVNEIVRWEYRKRGLVGDGGAADPGHPASDHRIIAGIQTESEEARRIFEPSKKKKARYVFFPGCNVYFQPDKLLSALDIMDRLEEDWAFLPGLDDCCGDVHLYSGEVERASAAAGKIVEALTAFEPEAVVLWCPTCLCRFEKTLAPAMEIPFNCISFAQFVAARLDRLPLGPVLPRTVTLHEACKAAYTGLDLTGAREILARLPGVTLREMDRHGKNTACCGSGAITFFPKSFAAVRDDRLEEAAATGAEVMVDVCHYCHHVFSSHAEKRGMASVNYVSFLAEALGIGRDDRYNRYRGMAGAEEILADVGAIVDRSPFSREEISAAVNRVILSDP
ncbi:MAG: (Fe-S)-binding protein [Desulfobacterales bacterium]|nr:(Fe-S)-binding protein [Desulfobacterales bacterium]